VKPDGPEAETKQIVELADAEWPTKEVAVRVDGGAHVRTGVRWVECWGAVADGSDLLNLEVGAGEAGVVVGVSFLDVEVGKPEVVVDDAVVLVEGLVESLDSTAVRCWPFEGVGCFGMQEEDGDDLGGDDAAVFVVAEDLDFGLPFEVAGLREALLDFDWDCVGGVRDGEDGAAQ
jgi:hypothetical protein